ncbi:hypothetical protein AJ79_00468 [Helicocarpus griseus UAMH5409]|uniref:Uncharacterized protein n=1 Tax=Helicocarpus griseus UAMH5409 TaxID=1447875 RepID=A0A2B7YB42_9EURO|nr:hypothetical protein AJ79_00468 [Helicocarpus griseus UAMH5409]
MRGSLKSAIFGPADYWSQWPGAGAQVLVWAHAALRRVRPMDLVSGAVRNMAQLSLDQVVSIAHADASAMG